MSATGRVWDASRAADAGIGRRRLAGPGFTRVTAGAYVEAEPAGDLHLRCAAVLSRVPEAVVSHGTAAALLGLPVPAAAVEPLHVTVGPGTRAPRRAGVRSHTAGSAVVSWTVRGVRMTPPWRTWVDCSAAGADLPALVALGDAVLHRWPTLDARLRAELDARGAGRGVRLARDALALLDGRAESAMESRLRVLLALAGLPAPVPQLVVRTHDGRFVARVDLAWPEHGLAVEYDGSHHLERVQWVRDLRRRERLEHEGWRVLVLTAEDVLGNPAGTVRRVRSALRL